MVFLRHFQDYFFSSDDFSPTNDARYMYKLYRVGVYTSFREYQVASGMCTE